MLNSFQSWLASLHNNELVIMLCSLGAAFGLGAMLIFVLTCYRYPKLRNFVGWTVARWVAPDRFEPDTWLHEFALALNFWLQPMVQRFIIENNGAHRQSGSWRQSGTRRPRHNFSLKPHGYHLDQQLATNRAYDTYLTADHKHLVKIAHEDNGQRLLNKEASVLDYLRMQARGAVYSKYLPAPEDRFVLGHQSAFAYPYNSMLVSARYIRERRPGGLAPEHVGWMFNRMLEVLGFAHEQRTVHCAVLPQHLLFDTENHALQLVDWTHSKRAGSPLTYIPAKDRKWYPRSATVATPALDIYMAARMAIYLAGEDHDAHNLPYSFPKPMRSFFAACLLQSPNMRPHDAWELHEEFHELLENVFGPPTFLELTLR